MADLGANRNGACWPEAKRKLSSWKPWKAAVCSAVDQYQRAACYIDRVLRGAKVADLPVQASDLSCSPLTMKTARAFGLMILPTLRARADEVIE
jgi:hypothetical protein